MSESKMAINDPDVPECMRQFGRCSKYEKLHAEYRAEVERAEAERDAAVRELERVRELASDEIEAVEALTGAKQFANDNFDKGARAARLEQLDVLRRILNGGEENG